MRNRFPLFNRAVVFIICVLMLVGIPYGFISSMARGDLNIVTALLMVVFGSMACWYLWVTLAWRERPPIALEEQDAVNLPPVSDRAVQYRYFTGLKSGAVLVDPESETIYFVNCYVPRRFLAVAQREYRCPVSNIRAIHRFFDKGLEWLIIATDAGKANIPNLGADFEALWHVLKNFVPENSPGFATDDPRMGLVWVIGAVGGIFGGWWLTPIRARDSTLALFVVCGAILGVIGGQMLIRITDHWFRVNIAKAVGYGTLGATAGLGIGSLMLATGWSDHTMIWTALGGFILGAGIIHISAFGKR